MVLEGIAIEWVLVVAGFSMLLVEVYNPGFFISVPGTVLIILGIFSLLLPDIFSSIWFVVIGVTVATCTAGITVWFYGRLTPGESPVTVSSDSLRGKEGKVIIDVGADSLAGKGVVGAVDKGSFPGDDDDRDGDLFALEKM